MDLTRLAVIPGIVRNRGLLAGFQIWTFDPGTLGRHADAVLADVPIGIGQRGVQGINPGSKNRWWLQVNIHEILQCHLC